MKKFFFLKQIEVDNHIKELTENLEKEIQNKEKSDRIWESRINYKNKQLLSLSIVIQNLIGQNNELILKAASEVYKKDDWDKNDDNSFTNLHVLTTQEAIQESQKKTEHLNIELSLLTNVLRAEFHENLNVLNKQIEINTKKIIKLEKEEFLFKTSFQERVYKFQSEVENLEKMYIKIQEEFQMRNSKLLQQELINNYISQTEEKLMFFKASLKTDYETYKTSLFNDVIKEVLLNNKKENEQLQINFNEQTKKIISLENQLNKINTKVKNQIKRKSYVSSSAKNVNENNFLINNSQPVINNREKVILNKEQIMKREINKSLAMLLQEYNIDPNPLIINDFGSVRRESWMNGDFWEKLKCYNYTQWCNNEIKLRFKTYSLNK